PVFSLPVPRHHSHLPSFPTRRSSDLFNQRVTQRTVPWLEFFHPYKHVCQMLWKFSFYFYSLFAPLVHYLHPTATVSLKPNLKQRSEEHTSELQSRENLVCRLLLEKKK